MNAVEELLRGHIRGVREAIAEATSRADALEILVDKVARAPTAAPTQRPKVDGWSKDEDELLRTFYSQVGAVGCAKMLTHRTPLAVRAHAHRLGLTFQENMKRYFCEQCDARVTGGQVAACQSSFCKGKALVAAARE